MAAGAGLCSIGQPLEYHLVDELSFLRSIFLFLKKCDLRFEAALS